MMNTSQPTPAATSCPPSMLAEKPKRAAEVPALTPLATEARAAIPTDEAARHLGRSMQTLRLWACKEIGPLRPIRLNGRLLWPVAELRRLLKVEAA